MQILVSGRHLRLPEDVQEYARSKASKLTHYYNKIRTVDIVIDKEGPNYMVEIIVKPDNHESFVARDSGPDVQACIDIIVDKLGRQITKYKEKLRNRKHQSGPVEI